MRKERRNNQLPEPKISQGPTPELPPVPTTIIAASTLSDQVIFSQEIDGREIFSVTRLDNGWQPEQLEGERAVELFVKWNNLVAPEDQENGDIIYPSQEDAIQSVREKFLEENPPRKFTDEEIMRLLEGVKRR